MSEQSDIAITYCSTQGNTESVAKRLQEALGKDRCQLFTVKEVSWEKLQPFPILIFGAPTFGMGDLDRRMQRRLESFKEEHLWEGKTVACFCMGDQVYHGKTFGGGLEAFHTYFLDKPVRRIGLWPDEGYEYESSNSVLPEGVFPGG